MSSKQHLFLEHSKEVASNKISSWDTLWRFYRNNISFEATLRSCILKTLNLRQCSGVVFPHFHFRQLSEMYPHITFSLRQFYVIIFSKYLLCGNSTKLYSQNISFKTTLQSRIIQKSLWGNSAELYSQNIHCKTTLQSCIPTFCFRATLQSCIS